MTELMNSAANGSGLGEYVQRDLVRAQDQLLTSEELEHILKTHKGWAAKDRLTKGLIPHVKIGRLARYRMSDVRAFLESSLRQNTSQAA